MQPRRIPLDTVSVLVHKGTFSGDRLEITVTSLDAGDRVVIVDDVIGTGCTADAAANLVGGCTGAACARLDSHCCVTHGMQRVSPLRILFYFILFYLRAEVCGATVVEIACVAELPELRGRERLAKRRLFVLTSAVGVTLVPPARPASRAPTAVTLES